MEEALRPIQERQAKLMAGIVALFEQASEIQRRQKTSPGLPLTPKEQDVLMRATRAQEILAVAAERRDEARRRGRKP